VECKEAALPDENKLAGAKYSFGDDVVLSDLEEDVGSDDSDSDSTEDSASESGSESDGGKKKKKSKKQKQREAEKRKKEKRKEKKRKEAEEVEKGKAKAMGPPKRKRVHKDDGAGEASPLKRQRSGQRSKTGGGEEDDGEGLPSIEERRGRELTLAEQRERNITERKEALLRLDEAWYANHPEQRPVAPKPCTKRAPQPKGSIQPVRRSTRQTGTSAEHK
jgi:hypothetical protein